MNKCGTCKYFGEEVMQWSDGTGLPTGLHTCDRIKHSNFYDYDDPAEYDRIEADLADVVDGSGYQAALRVREDFGCVLWEAKE